KTVGKQKELSSQQKIPFLANPILYNKQKFITKGGQLWTSKQEEAIQSGNLLHQVMAHIYKEEDIAPALSRALDMGWLSTEELDLLEKQILAIVQHPALQLFFVKNAIAWNEKDIVLNTGEIIRPDKFVIHNNQASVLDYKTGIPHKKHHLQLEQYAQAISEMGYTIHKKILVYSNEELEVKFV
ncbi:MAG: PD-(D/E)XK nuclease family protein, partial [Flavobacteriaceae bacterium]|nr:PD-(D/E)XK nuclease family protein [Flavobacteriaceae bacterium]